MRYFLCVGSTDGGALGDDTMRRYRARLQARCTDMGEWRFFAEGSVATSLNQRAGESGVAVTAESIAIGEVRLDNREPLIRTQKGGASAANRSDLDIVRALLESSGPSGASALLGDFGVVVWMRPTRKFIAVRDAFGAKALYYSQTPTTIAFSSHPSLLSDGACWNDEHVADYLCGATPAEGSTIFADVKAVPEGCAVVWRNRRATVERFWSAMNVIQSENDVSEDPIEEFTDLFVHSLNLRFATSGPTWSDLSGGLDSSSIVMQSHRLARLGSVEAILHGTITAVDLTADGDERAFSDIVVRETGVRNEQLVGFTWWQDDGQYPPLTEEPTQNYPFWSLERRAYTILADAGAKVLLCGFGADHYLTGNLYYIADWILQRRFGDAARELIRWAVSRRRSVWHVAHENVVMPLTPHGARRWLAHSELWHVPEWIDTRFARRFDMRSRVMGAVALRDITCATGGSAVSRFLQGSAWQMSGMGASLARPRTDLDVRYPYLYRPLVEFGLRLPHHFRVRPKQYKWILREAMRGVLPEPIRSRVTKGSSDGRMFMSLRRKRDTIARLLRGSILAQLGYVNVKKLQEGIDQARSERGVCLPALSAALSLETWLQVRTGRWQGCDTTEP